MKKEILAAAIAVNTLFFSAAHAEHTPPGPGPGPGVCAAMGIYAESAMRARQRGVPMRDVLRTLDSGMEDGAFKRALRGIVLDAYAQMRAKGVPSLQQTMITEFGNGVHRACADVYNDDGTVR